jgi:hypothetical protein
MNDHELQAVKSKLIGLFPRAELTQVELELWLRRLRHAPFGATVAALEDHKLEQDARGKKMPVLATILKAVSATKPRPTGEQRAPSLADVSRSERPEWAGLGDFEILLRRYRMEWHTDVARVDERRQSIEKEILSRANCPAKTAALLRAQDRQAVAYRRKVRAGCCGSLVAAGMMPDVAKRYARAVVRAAPETFRLVLDDIRTYGAVLTAAA